MRRSIALVIVLLMLGVASAVAVAWISAGVVLLEVGGWRLVAWSGRYSIRSDRAWSSGYAEDWGRRAWIVTLDEPPLRPPAPDQAPAPPSWSRVWQPWAPADRGRCWVEAEFGWPTHWLSYRAEDARLRRLVDRGELVERGAAIEPLAWGSELGMASAALDPPGWGGATEAAMAQAALPLGVHAWSAVPSILLWALAWLGMLLLLSMPWRWRDRRRRRRGRCVQCAHALGAPTADPAARATACPECGCVASARRPLIRRGMVRAAVTLLILVVIADAAWAAFLIGRRDSAPELHRAAGRGDAEAIERELAGGVNADFGSRGRATRIPWLVTESTPLMWAASAGHPHAVRRLLQAGADPNLRSFGFPERGVLEWAATSGSVEVMEELVRAGADPSRPWADDPGRTSAENAVVIAIAHGHLDLVRWLHERFPAPSMMSQRSWLTGGSPDQVVAAARCADPRMLPMVLDAWRDRLGSEQALASALRLAWSDAVTAAAEAGRVENVRELVRRRGTAVDLEDAMAAAARADRRDAVDLLLEAGVTPRRPACALLTALIGAGMTELAAWALEHGADPNCEAPGSVPAIALAIRRNDEAMVRMLIDAGASLPYEEDEVRWVGVLSAIDWMNTGDGIIETVFRLAGSVDRVDGRGRTALMAALRNGCERRARWLLDRGADPRWVDMDGWSVLDHAEMSRADAPRRGKAWWNLPTRDVSWSERRAVVRLIREAIESPPHALATRAPAEGSAAAGTRP